MLRKDTNSCFKLNEEKLSTLVELLQWRANYQPEQKAYSFLVDGIKEQDYLTYAELDKQAKAIASFLQNKFPLNSRIILIYPQGLSFLTTFFGCLYAGMIAIPTPAPEASRLKRLLPRVKVIAEDSQATILLTNKQLLTAINELNWDDLAKFDTEEILKKNLSENWYQPEITSETLAYLQYTSGSTSQPKGVMLSHENLMCHLADLQSSLAYDSNSITVNWMPYFHDYGLVEGILEPLYNGHPCYLMSPLSFIRHPLNWLQAIAKFQATHSQAPNFAYDYCVEKINPENLVNLNLNNWTNAGIGAETIKKETLEKFDNLCQISGFKKESFCPGYGLAEATLGVTNTLDKKGLHYLTICQKSLNQNNIIETENGTTFVSVGGPIKNTQIVIVEPETLTELKENKVGEIWVSSRGVAAGYWNNAEATNATFKVYLDNGKGPFLRTGDLGFINNGELYITGRLKDLIIIRGQNYYPQDIEWTVEKCHYQLRNNASAVFAIEKDGLEQIVIVAEVEGKTNNNIACEDIINKIRQGVAQEYELPLYAVVLIKRGTIAKTSSGKIQRKTCCQKFLNNELEILESWHYLKIVTEQKKIVDRNIIAPQNSIERSIINIWKRVFQLDNSHLISIKDNFFALGGDSLKAVQLLTEIEAVFSQKLPLSTFLEYPTIEKLAQLIELPQWEKENMGRSLVPLKPSGEKKPFFYVHPASGSVLLYGNLARNFPQNRPLYGLQAVGIDGKQEPLPSIEAMASHYIQEIKTVQPKGPYLIGGRCSGGKIAFEMAQQLLAQGEEVSGLIMVEAPYSRRRVISMFYIKKISDSREEEQRKNIETIKKIDSNRGNNFQKFSKIFRKNLVDYRPQMFNGQINYFYSKKNQNNGFEPGFGWQNLTKLEVLTHEVPGDHRTIDYEPNVKILAQKLCHVLDNLDI